MGKYEPLGVFLRSQGADEIPLTFEEIERIVGTKLPANSSNYPAWWSNNPTNNVMTKVWLDAGFRTEQVDVKARRLVFRRVGKRGVPPQVSKGSMMQGARHPLFGALKGLVRIGRGTDLTKPADPSWGDRA
jgi:hypothetical protein